MHEEYNQGSMMEDADHSEAEIDRPRAVLTPDDRKFLVGQKEFAGEHPEQQERNARYRIRERVLDAIEDFSFLNDELPEEELDTVFEKILEEDRDVLVQAVAFILRGVDDVTEVEEFLGDALNEAAKKKHRNSLVTIDFTLDSRQKERDPQEARERLLDDRGTFRDLEFLIGEGETKALITKLAEKDGPIKIFEHYEPDGEDEGEEYTLDDLILSAISP